MDRRMRPAAARPLIGITGPSGSLAWGSLAASLAVYRAGGGPVRLGPDRPRPNRTLEGIVVTGGSDIGPNLYGSSEAPWSPPDTIRDEFELAVLSFAERRDLPMLGICRGAQLLNVFAGGNLYTDISNLRRVSSNRRSLLPSKWVDVASGSRLESVLARRALRVNSLHHQAVKRLGAGLVAVAHDRDEIVQGIEATGERFCVGVQWHPEYLAWRRPHLALFRALVAAARPR